MECDIKVVESLKEGRGIKVLLVDGKEESATFLGEDKYELVYPYSIEIFSILSKFDRSSVLLFGGGGFSIPKYFISHYPIGKIDVVEIDPFIYELAKKEFFLSDLIEQYHLRGNQSRMRIFIQDAVEYLKQSDCQYKIIINDAYHGGEMSSELLSEESIRQISRHLGKQGIYIMNFFSALQGMKRKAWDEQECILKKYFNKLYIKQLDFQFPQTHRQNCIVFAQK